MLNITAQANAAGAKSYFAKSDYYSQGDEIVGMWGGKGAVLLGLFGQVKQPDFHALCDNLDPRTGKPLTRITRDDRRVGYDFTWSAPKSVSVVQALTGDEAIVEAFRDSIKDTMAEMEAEMQTRVRKGKLEANRTTGNLCYAEFVHLTSRPVDGMPCPQLHAHCFALNASYDSVEGQWKAGQFGKIKGDAYYWQAVQQARFARRLEEIGYSTRRTKDAFEIAGVPDSVIKKFSLRAGLIDRIAESLGITDPKRKAKLAATTREAKNDTIAYSELVGTWDKWLTPGERQTVIERPPSPSVAVENSRHARFAVDHLFERSSVVDERRVLALALRHGLGEVTPEGMRSEIQSLGLLGRTDGDKRWVTTPEIVAEERKMLAFAEQGRAACRPLAGGEVIQWNDSRLDDGQRRAVEHVITSPDRVMVLRGVAGTGKTTLTKEAVAQIERRGKTVVMLAPSAQASRGVLREEGFEGADTVARFLVDANMQKDAKDGVVWVDESGLIGSRTMAALFNVAGEVGARVVLAGDKRQLASVERGSPLRMLETHAGIKVVEVTDIKRQSGAYRDAVKLLSKGDASAGFEKLDALGWVKLMPDGDQYGPVAHDYAQAVMRGETAIIVCPTHAESGRVTEAVRHELRASGAIAADERVLSRLVPLQWTVAEKADPGNYLGEEVLQFHRSVGCYKAGQRVRASLVLPHLTGPLAHCFTPYALDSIRLSKGDLIRITANGKTADGRHKLNNGGVYTVAGFCRNGDLQLSNGWVVAKDFGQFSYGYANTAFAAQGRTVDRALIALSAVSYPASNSQAFYVAVSRGRKSATIYTDDKADLRRAISKSDSRMSATELVGKHSLRLIDRVRQALVRLHHTSCVAATAAARQVREFQPTKEHGYAR